MSASSLVEPALTAIATSNTASHASSRFILFTFPRRQDLGNRRPRGQVIGARAPGGTKVTDDVFIVLSLFERKLAESQRGIQRLEARRPDAKTFAQDKRNGGIIRMNIIMPVTDNNILGNH